MRSWKKIESGEGHKPDRSDYKSIGSADSDRNKKMHEKYGEAERHCGSDKKRYDCELWILILNFHS